MKDRFKSNKSLDLMVSVAGFSRRRSPLLDVTPTLAAHRTRPQEL
jgi:hypothetical protein